MSVGMLPEDYNKLNNIKNDDSSYAFDSDVRSSISSCKIEEEDITI